MDNRRTFIRKTALGAAGLSLGATSLTARSYRNIPGANERIHVAVVGLRNRGKGLIDGLTGLKDQGIRIKTVCDVDSQFNEAARTRVADRQGGKKPEAVGDMRRVLDDPDIDAVALATPNHWHALGTVWACQAGKHVYVEKPSTHKIWEGRKMVEAARKYRRIVQVGFQLRSNKDVREAIRFLHAGGIGDVYMARGLCFKPRDPFGIASDSEPPSTLDYDMWLGPADYRPYNEKRVHYNWHWHWNTGSGDTGNQGPHQFDIARWGLNKQVHPVRVQSMGGIFGFSPRECSQETPNTQTSTFTYEDGTILEFETRGRYTHAEAPMGVRIGTIFYGTEGWLEMDGTRWKAYREREETPFAGSGIQAEGAAVGGDNTFLTAPDDDGHFANFVKAMRSGDHSDLNSDILQGHMSSVLPLMANIAYRVGASLTFHGGSEQFTGNERANLFTSRRYRQPYVLNDIV